MKVPHHLCQCELLRWTSFWNINYFSYITVLDLPKIVHAYSCVCLEYPQICSYTARDTRERNAILQSGLTFKGQWINSIKPQVFILELL